MTKNQVLEESTYMEIMIALLEPSMIDIVSWHVQAFYETNLNYPKSVLNGVLIKAIQSSKESGNSFSKVYLEKIRETFDQYKVNTTSLVIKFLDNKHNHSYKRKKKKVAFVPEYMEEYEQDLLNN
ncbi:MAG: hypothetical protein RBQ91_00420 [Acholeplasma sp.]|nr:hypothetical protein [Acholeplasma sp.]